MKIEARHRDRTYPIEIHQRQERFEVKIEEKVFSVKILSLNRGRWTLEIEGTVHDLLVAEKEDHTLIDWRSASFPIQLYNLKDKLRQEAAELEMVGRIPIKAQMPGKVISVLLGVQDPVQAGQGLVVIEAMKMQNELKSPKAGKIVSCNVKEGKTVNTGELLFEIE